MIFANSRRLTLLAAISLSTVTGACRRANSASGTSSDSSSANASGSASAAGGVLVGTHWMQCKAAAGLGTKVLYLRDKVRFGDDGRIVFEGDTFATDADCQNAISEATAKSEFPTKVSATRTFNVGYKLGAETSQSGVYPIDVIYGDGSNGSTVYTTAAVSKDRLTISAACGVEQVYTGECKTVTGQSADARANRLSEEAYLFDLRARP
ncbi:MAG: hypothetical protein NTZ90_14605 [Proteobacteria bacterium]|nr:hypothetical protein [Pseudomonadota bacterium]